MRYPLDKDSSSRNVIYLLNNWGQSLEHYRVLALTVYYFKLFSCVLYLLILGNSRTVWPQEGGISAKALAREGWTGKGILRPELTLFSFSCSHNVRLLLEDQALRVMGVKFLLAISQLNKTAWSWELRTWSHKMKSTWYFNKFSPLLLLKTYRDNKWQFEFRCYMV